MMFALMNHDSNITILVLTCGAVSQGDSPFGSFLGGSVSQGDSHFDSKKGRSKRPGKEISFMHLISYSYIPF